MGKLAQQRLRDFNLADIQRVLDADHARVLCVFQALHVEGCFDGGAVALHGHGYVGAIEKGRGKYVGIGSLKVDGVVESTSDDVG